MKWLKKLLGFKDKSAVLKRDKGDKEIGDYIEMQNKAEQAGLINGKHHLVYIETVKQFKREKNHQKAIELLLRLIDAAESEAEVYKSYGWNWPTAPGYYINLAIIYRKEKRYDDEVAILERHQKQNNSTDWKELAERLKKARELLKRR